MPNFAQGSYTCTCPKHGYTGDGVECEDIDECGQENLCHAELGICTNIEGGYTCQCKSGYRNPTVWHDTANRVRWRYGQVCYDVNECDRYGNNDCHEDAICTNNEGASSKINFANDFPTKNLITKFDKNITINSGLKF